MLTICRGLPRSGKTTYAKSLGIHHFEADMFFVGDDGVYRFNPNLLKKAHQWCQANVRHHLAKGEDVVVSNTFTQIWEMQPYLDMAKHYGHKVRVVKFTNSYGENGHNVPEHSIEKMKARWEDYEGEEIYG